MSYARAAAVRYTAGLQAHLWISYPGLPVKRTLKATTYLLVSAKYAKCIITFGERQMEENQCDITCRNVTAPHSSGDPV